MGSFLRKVPGRSFTGPLPSLTPKQAEISHRLREHVQRIAGDIGGRSIRERPQGLAVCAAYVEEELRRYGLVVGRQMFAADGMEVANVVGERPASEEIIVFGAHYDTCLGLPGANDNASGIAATLFLAETLKNPLENQFASSSSRTKSHRTSKQNRWAVSYMRSDAVAKPRRLWLCCRSRRSATTPT